VVEDDDCAVVNGQGSEGSLQLVAVGYAGDRIIGRPIGLDQAKARRPVAHPASLRMAGAHEQLVRPCFEASRVSELRKALPDPQQGMLRRVLGQVSVAKDSMRHRLQPRPVDDHKRGERLLIPSLSRHHELGIHPSPHGAPVNAGVISRYVRVEERDSSNFSANQIAAGAMRHT
jgi:hypothetical protein